MRKAKEIADAIQEGVKIFVGDLNYYPTNKPYYPSSEESALQQLARSIGIGYNEGAKNLSFVKTPRGYQKRVKNAPGGSESFWIPYAHMVLDRIEDTAYGPLRAANEANQSVQRSGVSNASLLGYELGRIGADIPGHGLRKLFWNLNPEDASGTIAGLAAANRKLLDKVGLEPSVGLSNAVRFGTATGLGLAVGNWDATNLAEGGRPQGYEAITPSENDPRQSTQPVADIVISRGLLGRNTRLLPWEQFRQEKPDVSYEQYQNYKDYLYNRNPGFLSNATFGLLKGTPEGIDGDSPEVRMLGYRITPEGIVGATVGASIPVLATKAIRSLR